MPEPTRSLRTAERYLLAPPLAATFDDTSVAVCDISEKGARFRHDVPLRAGGKSILRIAIEGGSPLAIEAAVVWSQPDGVAEGMYLSGVRTYGPPESVSALLQHLRTLKRTSRIEELRSTDRFYLDPTVLGSLDGEQVWIEDLSARGARIELAFEPLPGSSGTLSFAIPDSRMDVSVKGEVRWTGIKSIVEGTPRRFRAGLLINEKPELMRLTIGRLSELGWAALDAESLRLKLKIIRARARQMAHTVAGLETSGIPAEQYLLIQGVREELRLNPEEAMHWYRRARLIINDPATRTAAPPIADHPDALAVWEYLDRSIDPSIVGRAFEIA